ncbi:HNH endonuclease [Caldicellulosiruptor hydrothermalis 108]|uniref:HNH endonuclease n=1 Tax=Caldicellulosiruptor hydrothermalis (strain DSM 18901 / VKM B-2411 / 108) TaxID=632292 RepID=E4QBZ4_CALH1|nr:RRXRR domain-containing protein [Caldicellulosiruptor hydrothermalis]ADQ06168.1 HNH endonuclease [Caldicellulosiruptor hydrothermalis 108]
MLLFTIDRNGKPGHPTRRFDMVRKLVKRRRAKIIGGGASGKPPVVMFLDREFDYSKTVSRKLIIVLDPGYHCIGFVVCELKGGKLIVYCTGILVSRIPEIKELITERKAHRRNRRYYSRCKKKRLSARQNRVLLKFKVPRTVRDRDRLNATLRHGIETHLNLYKKLLKFFPFPAEQVVFVMEDNIFDVRTMTWGKTDGTGYQKSPRVPAEKKCIICGSKEKLQKHHLIQRKYGGTDIRENVVYLCRDCHEDVHAGRVYIPVEGVRQWRALGTVNAIIGRLREIPWLKFVPASDVAQMRKRLGLEKGHANDALATAAVFCNCTETDRTHMIELTLVKFRRHNRARIHAVRDRLYKVNGKIVAKNRRKRTDQKEPSFADISPLSPEIQRKLKVYPGTKILNPLRKETPTIAGDVWIYEPTGKRFVATGVVSQKYLYSPQLEKIVGKTYVKPEECKRVLRNEGIVVMYNSLYHN